MDNRTEKAPAVTTQAAPAPAAPTPAHRPKAAIKADLAAKTREHAVLHKKVDELWAARQLAVTRRLAAEKMHKANPAFAGIEFDPDTYPGGLAVPPLDSPEAARFHRVHEEIAALERELAAARAAR